MQRNVRIMASDIDWAISKELFKETKSISIEIMDGNEIIHCNLKQRENGYVLLVFKDSNISFKKNPFDMPMLKYEDEEDYTRFKFKRLIDLRVFLSIFPYFHKEYFCKVPSLATMTVA